MTKQTKELLYCFKRAAQDALKVKYGFCPQKLSDIEIFDGNGHEEFKFRVGGHEYQLRFYAGGCYVKYSPDGVADWVARGSVTQIK